MDFTWVDGERLIRFGEPALDEASGLLASRGFGGFALLTTRRAAASAPALASDADVVVDVAPGPVPDAAARAREEAGGRPLVALGGGRVIDSAKAIAGADGLRCAAVPTTLSGAEMTPFHRMPAGVEELKLVRPALVVAVPSLMVSQPMPALAASAMNALAHAVEALYTPMANPVSELTALRAIESIASGLRDVEPERPRLALGALLAGYASGVAGFAVHHAVCQTIVRVAGTPHAQTNAVMLPHVCRFMEPRAPEPMRLAGNALAGRDVADLAVMAGVTRLSELGFEESRVGEVVAAALQHPAIGNTPGPPGEEELTALVLRAL